MDTFFARNRLSAYLDGSLPEAEAAEVEAAISDDAELRREFDEMRRAVELLRTVGPAEAPPGFHARVLARVEAEPAPTGVVSLFRRTMSRAPVEALALAAAALIVVMVIQQRGEEEEAPDDALAAAELERKVDLSPPDAAVLPPSEASAPPPPVEEVAAAPAVLDSAPVADGDLRTAAASAPAKVAPPPSADKQAVQAKGGPVPAQPYVADWEQQGVNIDADAEPAQAPAALYEGIDLAGPLAYKITLPDEEILYQLSARAEKHGGRLIDSKGRSLDLRPLGDEDGWMRVHVVVPREVAAGFQADVRALGGIAIPPPADAVMYGADHAVFVIELAYQP